MPTVSVIVPNYNHARFLRQRIDSILAQTYQDFELILLDDCSTDDSRDVLQSYAAEPRVAHVEFNERNSGTPFAQWNKGVRFARGKYVWMAESDDYADPRFLERLVPVLEGNPRIQLVYCQSWEIAEDGQRRGLLVTFIPGFDTARWTADFRADGPDELRRCMVYACTIQNASGAVFRRMAYQEVGGADESLRICGDWKMWCSLMLAGEIAYVAEPLNFFRSHEESAHNRFGLWREGIVEWLSVVRWTLDRVQLPETTLRGVRAYHAGRWVRAILSRDIPWRARREILRAAKAIDPHPIRSGIFLPPTLIFQAAQRILSRPWYGLLNLTYHARHSHGFTREGLARARAKFGR